MAKKKKVPLGDIYFEAKKKHLAEKVLTGQELDAEERRIIAEILDPELFEPDKRPAHRPDGTETTVLRDFNLCLEYLRNCSPGCSDSVYSDIAGKYGMKVSAVRKAVTGKKLNAIRNALKMGFAEDHHITWLMYLGEREKISTQKENT